MKQNVEKSWYNLLEKKSLKTPDLGTLMPTFKIKRGLKQRATLEILRSIATFYNFIEIILQLNAIFGNSQKILNTLSTTILIRILFYKQENFTNNL